MVRSILVKLCIIAAAFVFFSCSDETDQPKEAKSEIDQSVVEAVQSNKVEPEIYREADPNEFRFELRDVYYTTEIAQEDGNLVAIPLEGEIGALLCNGVAIDLEKTAFEDGCIVTKEFGKIKFRPSRSLSGGGFRILMTQTQQDKLRGFLTGAAAQKAEPIEAQSGNDPLDYTPIEKETERLLVPEQYATIQEAVDAAESGATIVIAKGRYHEQVNISTKALKLTSANPLDMEIVKSTIIDAKQIGTAVSLSDSSSIVVGLTIQGGSSQDRGGGIYISGSASPLVKGNIIEGNVSAGPGGGIIMLEADKPRIIDNTIQKNKAEAGAGLFAVSTAVYMKGNTIMENAAGKGGGGVFLQDCTGRVEKNEFVGNSARAAGAGMYISKNSEMAIYKNQIESNDAPLGAGMFVIGERERQPVFK